MMTKKLMSDMEMTRRFLDKPLRKLCQYDVWDHDANKGDYILGNPGVISTVTTEPRISDETLQVRVQIPPGVPAIVAIRKLADIIKAVSEQHDDYAKRYSFDEALKQFEHRLDNTAPPDGDDDGVAKGYVQI